MSGRGVSNVAARIGQLVSSLQHRLQGSGVRHQRTDHVLRARVTTRTVVAESTWPPLVDPDAGRSARLVGALTRLQLPHPLGSGEEGGGHPVHLLYQLRVGLAD